jgi:hypothetical protein
VKSIIQFFRWPLAFPIYAILGEYLLWALLGPMDYSAGLEDISNFAFGLIAFGLFIIITVAVYAARNSRVFSLLMLLALLPIAGLCLLYVSFSLSEMNNFGWPESRFVFLLALAVASVYPALAVLRVARSESSKVVVWFFLLLFPLQAASIAYPINFGPEILDTVKSGGYTYHITALRDSDYHTLNWFYKCKYEYLACRHLFSSYGMAPEFLVDKTNGEVSLLNFGNLVVTDRAVPVYYTSVAGEMDSKLYVLSWDYSSAPNCRAGGCGAYIYTLNACNLDLTGCGPLPIQYTSHYDIYAYWLTDEVMHEISLYKDDESGPLIFTYGESSRCYVEDCKILDEAQK